MNDENVDGIDGANIGDVPGKKQDNAFIALKAEKKAIAEKYNLEKARADKLEDERKLMGEAKLKEQNEWKTLAEQKELEAKEFRAKYEDIQTSIVDAMKINAFNRHLGGKIKNEEYEQFIPLDSIAYNPETRKVDDESAKNAAADFFKKHAALVEVKAGKMPNEAASSPGLKGKRIEDMTPQEIEKHIKDLHSAGRL